MVRTLIVDDEPDIRFLLRMKIRHANNGLEVVGEAEDGEDAVSQWREQQPDVVIMDNRMPGLTGIEAAAQILHEAPKQAIIIFSAFLDAQLVDEAARIGVRVCLSKDKMDAIPETIWSLVAA